MRFIAPQSATGIIRKNASLDIEATGRPASSMMGFSQQEKSGHFPALPCSTDFAA